MSNLNSYIDRAKEIGFTKVSEIAVSDISPSEDIRALCAPGKCISYGTNWVCPPGCGSFDDCCKRLFKYHRGLLLQTKFISEKPFSVVQSKSLAMTHNQQVLSLRDELLKSYPKAMSLSTGGCGECEICTYPHSPCRKPGIQRGSMSAFGIDVGALCEKYGFEFAFTNSILYFMACILTD